MKWLIRIWKELYRLWSVKLLALIPIVAVATEYLPELQVVLPESWYVVVAVAAIVARAIKQGTDEDKDDVDKL